MRAVAVPATPRGVTALEWLVGVATVLLGVVAGTHALLHKRRPQSAAAWVGLCLLVPGLGALLYFLFGINRARRRAGKLRSRWVELPAQSGAGTPEAAVPAGLVELAHIGDAVSDTPLRPGNAVEALHNGEAAYPAMLEAIDAATTSVDLSSYIFDRDVTGRRFVDALEAAQQRGAEVRVLVDGLGALYSFPPITGLLRKRGVRAARFLPPRLVPPSIHINLRTHHKLLVVDRALAFTGGMNIGDRHLAASQGCSDVHFRVSGPIVSDLGDVFLRDWEFATGETVSVEAPTPSMAGSTRARVVLSGPDENLGAIQTILLGAISASRREIQIMTPYFLPPREMIGSLQSAALRGVDVTVILPERNNLPPVQWASRNMLWELLERGVRVLYQPPPFSHSKLFVVDRHYAQVGSANLDPRSLRLNFELNLELYGERFAGSLADHFDAVAAGARVLSLAELDARTFPVRLRDGLAWLMTPYL